RDPHGAARLVKVRFGRPADAACNPSVQFAIALRAGQRGGDAPRAACRCVVALGPTMTAELLPGIELETAPNPTASVVWLHGLGADGNDFVPIVPELRLPSGMATRFVFPHAPV